MEDILHRSVDEDVVRHVVFDEREVGVPDEMGNIARITGDEIVDRRDAMSFAEQSVAEV